ncbi:MAG: carboxypeptidase-like regulatory domain-containing protein [Bacteroides sp.]|jgi:hypothetical protein|nr:carboxypeptidase-like regulatory domain-containing protein [Bacteroides sp.]MCI1683815.1 carboxypeptidase-like regulatory domain-containing protein [Bacteroides sp.]
MKLNEERAESPKVERYIRVKTENKEPLLGVSIIEKGTHNGTISDLEGYARLSVASGAILVFSFVGYCTQEIKVGSNRTIDVVMKEC